MNSDGFRVGGFWIEWRDDETISITNTRNGVSAVLHGGDFESVLGAMVECARLSVREALA